MDIEKKELADIIIRNRDVEHIMHASCQYGFHRFGRVNPEKLFSMLVTTDIHQCTTQLESAIAYLNYHDSFDCGICLGDMQARNYIETDGTWYTNVVNRSEKEFYTLLGNHDLGNSADIKISATPKMAFDKFMRPVAEKIGIEGLETPYYAKVFDRYKIVLIALNNYDTPDTLNENGDFAINRCREMYSQKQTDWLISTLASVPEGYHVLIAMHGFPYETEAIDCPWTQEAYHHEYGNNPYGDNNMLTDIVDAWINGKAFAKDYAPIRNVDIAPTISVDCDFTKRGKGDFVCYLIGHQHRDIMSVVSKYKNQKIVCLAATGNDNWQNYCSDLARERGTKAEDAITAFSVHTEKRQVRLVRIGSNFTMNMTERTYYVLEY